MAKVAGDIGSTANRYQILAKLAVGGMAEIYLARGASVGGVERYCVLKRILRERASDAQFVQMFLDEIRLAAQLQHPNIAAVYDVGMLGDSYFFTMEYVHGQTVQSLVQRAIEQRRPLPLACVLTIIAGAAAGLQHAHDRLANDGRPLGIVHRDVSPSNVMVSYEGNIKLVDFGVAKADDRAVETQSGTVKGKISYLSPEQCQGTPVDRRSDLFSLGIVMWEMLTGARLYRRATDFENMVAIVNEPPPPPSSRRADIPRAIDAIVLRLLTKRVTERFQTAAELVEAIEHASMRAATLLSTSAVSRLVRDLFGTPAEPWLDLDGETLPRDPLPLEPKPVRAPVERAAADAVERELAAAPDLSAPQAYAHLRDSAPSSLPSRASESAIPIAITPPASAPPTARPEPSGRHRRPTASTPTVQPPQAEPSAPTLIPESRMLTARPAQAAPSAPTWVPGTAAQPVQGEASGRTRTPTGSTATVQPPQLAPSAPRWMPTGSPIAAQPTQLAPSAPTWMPGASPAGLQPPQLAPSTPTWMPGASPAGLQPPQLAPSTQTWMPGVSPATAQRAHATPAGRTRPSTASPQTATVSSPIAAEILASPSGPTRTGAAARAAASTDSAATHRQHGAPPPHTAWPLVAVIVTAAAIGVGAVWLSTHASDPHGGSQRKVVAPQAIEAQPAIAQPALKPSDADKIEILPDHVAAGSNALPASTPVGADGAPATTERPSPATAPQTPATAPQAATPAPQPTAAAPQAATPAPQPTAAAPQDTPPAALPARPAPPSITPAPPSTAQAQPAPSFQTLSTLYQNHDYAGVVAACSKASVAGNVARICTMAACYQRDAAQAKRWAVAVLPTLRAQLATNCKQAGDIDIATP